VLLDSLTSFVRATSASVLLLTDESRLVIGALRGYGEGDGAHTPDDAGAVGARPVVRRILEQGETVIVSDAERDDDGRPLLARADVRSWIGVPLRAAGNVIGLCAVESTQAAAFGRDDVDWVEALTAQAAAAIENARLHHELRRHASELEQRVAERTQDLNAAKEDAERANRAKNDFLAGISHELRTPMNAILGFAQLLELDGLEGEQEDNVRQILRAGRHLLELITELLDIARIEAGELALSLEAVGLEHLLVEAVDLTRPLAEQHDVTMSVLDEAGGYLFADRQRVLQVLLNLLANAAKYNRRGGTIDVVCTESAKGRVAIAVRDTGDGIDPADLERLFAPFERLGHEQGTIEGVGLGLTLVQRLVHAMGGTISVESAPGTGSTFTVELPRADDPLAALADDALAPASREREATVLYIEDNLANLQLVERALARRPELTVLSATQGRLGLDLARERRPDVILLDLHLPDVSGEDVLDELGSSPETGHIPVVIVSAAASKGRVRMLRERGAYDYLTKPIDLSQLLEVVNSALADHPRAQSSG
jgi:signal transduction histidine kinase/ActR/RegA family two-component response regulator